MTYFIIISNCQTLQFILPYATLKKNGIETLLRHLIGVGHFNGMVFFIVFQGLLLLRLTKMFSE